jgi:ubiquinone/menaquinone biosynthesis C-methylase UbiE
MSVEPETVRAFEHAGWQRAAASYADSFAPATAPFIAPLLAAAAISPGARVLDVACGPGYVAAAAAVRGAVAQGLDFSAAMVAIARARHPDIAVQEGDAEDLPYPDGAFDAVVSNFGMHHVPRPELALAQARRVLVVGGRVTFTVWAAPADNTAWGLVFDAAARHGVPSAAQAPGGSFNQIDDCLRALDRAGFADTAAEFLRAEWPVESAQALLAAMSAGTVRMAALIAAQEPSTLPAIVTDIERHAARYRRGDHLALPIAAILARGKKL